MDHDALPELTTEKRVRVEVYLAEAAERADDPEARIKLNTQAAVLAVRTNKERQDCESYCRFLNYTRTPHPDDEEVILGMIQRNGGSCQCD